MSRRADVPRLPSIAWIERRSRTQRRVALVAVVLVAVWRTVGSLADVVLSKWWLDTVTDAPVWSTRVGAQAWLFVLSTLVSTVVLGGTLRLVLRSGPVSEPPIWIERYHKRFGPAHAWVATGVVVVVVWRIATTSVGLWREWLMFWHATDLGAPVPEIGHDLGYYLFRLPLLAATSDWFRQLVLFALVIALVGHVLSGALQLPGGERRTAGIVGVHVGLLLAVLAAAEALHLVFVAIPRLALDRTGSFDGAGYTQVHAMKPALWVLAILSVTVGALCVEAVRRNRWRPVLTGAGVWVVVAVLGLWVVPGTVQSLVVAPAEAERELPYLTHHLTATRQAYRLDLVDRRTEVWTDGIDGAPTDQQLADVARIPVFDEEQSVDSFQVLQGTQATRISDIDLQRYEFDGSRHPVLVGVRNASRRDLPEPGWVQRHLVYTHGNGLVAAPADAPADDGRPDLETLSDLSPERSEVYVGEGLDGWYAIVGTKRQEQDGARFDAGTGIDLGSRLSRLVVALAVGEVEPFLSAELTDESQLLMNRGIRERLHEVAPFLQLDGDPDAVVADGRIVWIVDAYTSSSTYPYAQFARTAALPASSDLSGSSLNYLHGSVKATIDAYSGEVSLYRTAASGEDDPVLDVWDDIFPGLLQPIDAMPAAIREHLHYPSDLFTVQAELLGRYHVDTPESLFDGTQRWSVSPATASGVGQQASGLSNEVTLFAPEGSVDAGRWVTVRTFNPGASSNPNSARDGLAAVAIADNDDAERMTLVDVDSATARQISSPQVAQSAIDAEPSLAREFTVLNSNGSRVAFGPMTLVTLGDRVVWMRTVIVTGTSPTSTPHLYKVLVVSNGSVGQGSTAAEALADAAD